MVTSCRFDPGSRYKTHPQTMLSTDNTLSKAAFSHMRAQIKVALCLRKRANRLRYSAFLVEGVRELQAALLAGWSLQQLFLCEAFYDGALHQHLAAIKCPIHKLTPQDFNRIAYRADSGGVVGMVQMRQCRLSALVLPPQPLILVLDGVEKPGNVGAILRIAAVAGIDAVVLCGTGIDPYNPNVIRNSLGALFVTPWAEGSMQEVQAWISQHSCQLLGLDPAGQCVYNSVDMCRGTALVLGAEARGLSSAWRSACTQLLSIPMRDGPINSLNVASTASIVTYEALRQRSIRTNLPDIA